MAWTKNIKKIPKKAYKKVYGSRKFPQAVSATGKVAKDVAGLTASVAMIMSRLNVEKKNQTVDLGTFGVGQVSDSTNDGNVFFDVTPTIQQGTDSNQRIGNSLKLTGMNFPLQISSQTNTFGDRKVRIQIFKVLSADNGVSAQEMFEDYYDVNPLNGIRDMSSPRKYATSKQNGVKLLRTKYYKLKGIQIYNPSDDAEKQTLTVNLPLKMNDVLRYDGSANTSPDGTRYFMVVQCDTGNRGGNAPSTLDVPVTKIASGVEVRMVQKYWWVDN